MTHSSHIPSDSGEQSSSSVPSYSSTADGPVTVMNTGQQNQREAVLGDSAPNVDSELLRRLFPSDSSLEPPADGMSVAGCELEHYRVEQQIGRGGMGAVFRAVDERLDRIVALKVLSPVFSRDAATVTRFQNEAKAAARLDHENIARVFHTGVDKGVHFIAFEYVTGTNLRELIRSRGRIGPAEAVNYALQIASALRHTDAAGVVHRDIKPSNIIITPSGRAKLVDLGLARKEYSDSALELTVAGTTLGTFDYISPEQARDPRNVDVRSDIYSLGCTMYHMLTGEAPYPDGTFFKKLLDRQDKAPPDPSLRNPEVPEELAVIVQRMMAANPRHRHANADQLVNDLMLVAGKLGLRGIHPDGLVWTTGRSFGKSRFWEKHLGWMVTAAMLLIIVFVVERLARDDQTASNQTDQRNKSAFANRVNDLDGGTKNGKRPAKSPGGKQAPVVKKTGDDTPFVKRPERIPIELLKDSIWETVAPGAGVLGAAGVAARFPQTKGINGSVKPPVKVAGSNAKEKTKSNTGGTAKSLQKPPQIAVLAGDADSKREFPSLESACAAAEDGQVILLAFNGIRRNEDGTEIVDRPLKLTNKSISIRAAEGFRPVILFAGGSVPSSDPQTRMITLSKGSLNIKNVGFILAVDESIDSDNETRWALFSLTGADRVRLQSVRVTIRNPKSRLACVFEVAESSGPDIAKMKMMKKMGTEPAAHFEAIGSNCIFRGNGDVFALTHSRPGLAELSNAAVAIGGSLLRSRGQTSGNTPSETARVDLRLGHVTCLTKGPAFRFDVQGMLPGAVLPVRVSSRNSIYSLVDNQPLVAMTGNYAIEEFRRLLGWEGEKNFYDGARVMWNVVSQETTAAASKMTFDDWIKHWGTTQDVDARLDGVVWKSRPDGSNFATVTAADFQLKQPTEETPNPAVSGATDGMDAGADLTLLPGKATAPPKIATP